MKRCRIRKTRNEREHQYNSQNHDFHGEQVPVALIPLTTFPPVLQRKEGTFWRASLWREVGGIDSSFRLAGDWDLWRRFAQRCPLYRIKVPLARFTRREGQKSQDMVAYYAEVDAATPTSSVGDATEYRLTRLEFDLPWSEETIDHAEPIPSPPQITHPIVIQQRRSWLDRFALRRKTPSHAD